MPQIANSDWAYFQKTLHNSEKKRALQIVEDLDHRKEDGENLICLPCVAERTPVICMIKKLDRLLINWILNQILYNVIIQTTDKNPQSPPRYVLQVHFVYLISVAVSLHIERKIRKTLKWLSGLTEYQSSSFYAGHHSLCLFPEEIRDHVLLMESSSSFGPGTGTSCAQRNGPGGFTGIFHPQLSAPSRP